ncbi:hypothetical protein BT69DRAFT_1343148 [Atractiella rhizophila]|nr:hypothetical protein BT69DRAFT_1343148 [Atractiella rhizophila]
MTQDNEEEDLSPYISLAASPVNSLTTPLHSFHHTLHANSSSQPFPFSQTPTSHSLAISRPVTPPKRSDEEVSPVVSPALKRIRLTKEESAQQKREKLNDYVAKAAQIEQLLQQNTFVTHLQGRRVRALETYYNLLKLGTRGKLEASQLAAASHRFGLTYGARCIRLWASHFEETGRHIKTYTLLNDPEICAILRTWLRTKKWSMDPTKLAGFHVNTMVPLALEKVP